VLRLIKLKREICFLYYLYSMLYSTTSLVNFLRQKVNKSELELFVVKTNYTHSSLRPIAIA